MSERSLVLVTGGTGFLAVWVIVSLFRQGYRVRTTVRSLKRAENIAKKLSEAGINEDQVSSLEVVQADLVQDDGWADAMKDVKYVQHIASPFPDGPPKDEDELLIPALEGTLRVLRFSRDAGSVVRVVVTSSAAAVIYGRSPKIPESDPFTEVDWTDVNSKDTTHYPKSKTLAERAAWDFIEKEGGELELAVVNPVVVLGPTLGPDVGTSLHTVSELLEGNAPGLPRLSMGIVDVRDCATLHVLVMTHPDAKGERFLCIGEGSVMMEDIAKILKKNLGPKARKVPSIVLPDFLMRAVAIFLPIARLILPDLGHQHTISNAKATETLGWKWQYTSEQAIMASAESLFRFDVVKAG
ncbi:hypothetical protein UA08_06928 [Talaromyces atroroseus]|uniref:NAD-dependent epimerase/dehydratase domain-containing protein n=1 Tax=Talaromyces atroroseus TaxID=1441469 RepID=A0A225ARZ5_TALAT|nr:hypothetical protein UA08_06928 [Talaromyces atroroseus]OKL57736.1 hypothetical protein UA08_06928 [Talaromyces atroroseus]